GRRGVCGAARDVPVAGRGGDGSLDRARVVEAAAGGLEEAVLQRPQRCPECGGRHCPRGGIAGQGRLHVGAGHRRIPPGSPLRLGGGAIPGTGRRPGVDARVAPQLRVGAGEGGRVGGGGGPGRGRKAVWGGRGGPARPGGGGGKRPPQTPPVAQPRRVTFAAPVRFWTARTTASTSRTTRWARESGGVPAGGRS